VSEPRTIAILGGGISGLALAEAVARYAGEGGTPIRAIVLEAERELGGKIKTSREEGFVVETGPHGFLDKEPKALALIERLGLSGSLLRANEASANRFIVRAGRLRKLPASPPAFLKSDILPLGARLRVVLEPFAKKRPPELDESVWEFAARRIGRRAADVLVDAMVTGIYGGDPKMLSLASAFPRMRELEDQYGSLIKAQIAIAKEGKARGAAGSPGGTLHSFTEGLGTLLRALAARAEVRTGAAVERISRSASRFAVEGRSERIEADAVISALPAYDVARLIEPLAAEESRALGEIPYAPVAVVVHGFAKGAIAQSLEGFGFLAPHGEERRILGSIWASTVFPPHVPEGAVMLRTMVGGARSPELLERSDTEVLAMVREELSALMGIAREAPAVLERVIRWPRAIPQYNLGHRARVAAADRAEERVPGLFFAGNAFRGVAMIACVADADGVARRAVAYVARAGM
jgi:oxygen-dependent protoporphyrinogen oxidase